MRLAFLVLLLLAVVGACGMFPCIILGYTVIGATFGAIWFLSLMAVAALLAVEAAR